MNRILLIFLIVFFGTAFFLIKLWTSALPTEWGHHFSFDNQLGIEVDSLHISVGGINTSIISADDSLNSLEGVIDVPKSGYPHEVIINVFSQGQSRSLSADSFDCYNCDGNHEYILSDSMAVYRFRN